jgi:putative acetyltransferase
MNDDEIRIRPECEADHARVHEIHSAAFGGSAEADLVDAMRGRVSPEVSLVAEIAGRVVGHVYFSPVHVGESRRPAMGLAPVAVDPACQRGGVGSALCRSGLARCRELRQPVVFVLGHADYYPRFGFEPALPHGLFYKNEHFAPAFFVVDLDGAGLSDFAGEVRYHPAFDSA